ncbi:MAG: hypothetical protein COY19_10065, partial [Candidatus Marinimicrobia bacterium CG_4_10_14_0_2_um_filter_48_9]
DFIAANLTGAVTTDTNFHEADFTGARKDDGILSNNGSLPPG